MESPITTDKPSILLVEDEKIAQLVHLTLLKGTGYHIDLAETGEQALAKFNNSYALIFMDIGLPDIAGTEVTTKIRKHESGKHIPIIALTAYSDDNVEAECLAAGMTAVYTKPITAITLEHILETYISVKMG